MDSGAKSGPKKHSLFKKILLGTVIFVSLVLGALYWIISSPQFLSRVVEQLNTVLAGKITYQSLLLNLETRRITALDLKYLNVQNQTVFGLDELELKFSLVPLFRGRLEIQDLYLSGLVVHTENYPKSEKATSWRPVLKFILNRLTVQNSQMESFSLFLKEGRQLQSQKVTFKITKPILREQKVNAFLEGTQLFGFGAPLKLQQVEIDSSFTLPVLAEVPFFVEEADGSLKLNQIELPEVKLEKFSSQFKVNEEELQLSKGKIISDYGSLDLDLGYAPQDYGIRLKLKNETPISFEAIPKVSERLKSTFKAWKIDLELALKRLPLKQMTGQIALKMQALGNHQLDNTPDHDLELKGRLNKGKLDLELFEIHSKLMELQGKGSIDFAQQNFDVGIETHDFDITTMVNTLADIDLKGYANAHGTITGTFKNPTFKFEASARDAGYSFMNFGKTEGVFTIEDRTLSYVGRSPEGEGYGTEVNVQTTELFNKLKRRTVLQSAFRDIPANQLLLNEEFQGKISGTYNMEALPDSVETGELEAKIEKFVVYDFHFDELTVIGKLADDKFTLDPVTFKPPDLDPITLATPIVFSFDDRGWTMEGKILAGLSLSGGFQKAQPTHVEVNAQIQNVALEPVLASMLLPAEEAYGDGEVKMSIGLDEAPSSIDLKFTRLQLPLEEGEVHNEGPIEVEIRPPHVNFKQVKLSSGEGDFEIRGSYTLDGPMDLQMNGKLNLGILSLAPQYFRGGEGFADFDLKVGGKFGEPSLLGTVDFSNAGITLRPLRATLEGLNGQIRFTPNTITFNQLSSIVREGDLRLQGEIQLKNQKPSFYNLEIAAREVSISEPETYKIIFSGDFTLKGPAQSALLRGGLDINDGVYSRDFSIAETILKPKSTGIQEEKPDWLKDIRLDLRVRSPGDLAVRNNIANIHFNADMRAKGTLGNPQIRGALEVLEGTFHYFTVDFEDAQGTIDFRGDPKGPYVDIKLEKEYEAVENIIVQVLIQGFTENLQMNFTSNPPLKRQDLLALVFTGALPGGRRSLSGENLARTVLLSQLSAILQKPLERKAKIDIFRLEAADETSENFSSLVIGKKLTDRFSLEFKTDLGVDQPLQGVQMEYLLLDNVLLKGTQFTNGEFDFDLAYRIRLF